MSTVCFTDLDQGGEMIIFALLFTTFEASFFFAAAGRYCPHNWLELKSIHYWQINLPKPLKHTL